jgi:hypothetical protein
MDLAYDLALINEEGLLEALDDPQRLDWDTLEYRSFQSIKDQLDEIKDAEK